MARGISLSGLRTSLDLGVRLGVLTVEIVHQSEILRRSIASLQVPSMYRTLLSHVNFGVFQKNGLFGGELL
jgi:hypothetical protein